MLSPEQKLDRLQKALDAGGNTHEIEDLVRLHDEKKIQWWTEGDGSIITEIHDYPRRRAVHYWLLSGDLRDVLGLEERVNAWAVSEGCTIATAVGRPGWGRVAHRTGWRPWWPTFQKVLVP
jgi:hypothetical protein